MGEDPLVAAVRSGAAEAVKALVEGGADPNAVDEHGTPVLCLAVDAFDLPVLTELLFADPPVQLNRGTPDGRTPLLRAIDRGACEITSGLVNAGAHLYLKDAGGRDALELARHWHVTGAEAELRRRSGATGPVVRRAARDGWGNVCEELSLGGLTVRNGHAAILTELEPAYGIKPSFAELLGRALTEPDVDQPVWFATTFAAHERDDPAVRAEAAALRDRPDPLERHFGAQVLRLALLFDESDDDSFERPIVDLFLSWAAEEDDPRVMRPLAAGLADALDPRAEQALHTLIHHCDPEVRRWALSGLTSPAVSGDPEALAAALTCTRDPDAAVREQACRALTGSRAPADALAACLTDEAEAVRVTAAIGLFLRDDTRGDAVLRALGPVEKDSPYYGAFHQVWHHHRALGTAD
ncbi:HEAT repeat domain-containing protein [Streptomyces klenkii]|uniref:HEAT repeat domain-containing protein n=1 Tax=Streptomyces klenkii TaxID=1420899 RepID=UPI0033A993FC